MDLSKSLMDVILGIRNVLQASGRFLIIHHQEHFFELHISVVYQMFLIFKDKSIYGVSFNQGCHPVFMDQEHSWSSSIRKVLDGIFFWGTYECDISNCMYFSWQIHWWGWKIPQIPKFQIPKFQNSKKIKKSKKSKIPKNLQNQQTSKKFKQGQSPTTGAEPQNRGQGRSPMSLEWRARSALKF